MFWSKYITSGLCYVPLNARPLFPDFGGGEACWGCSVRFSLLYVWLKELVDERDCFFPGMCKIWRGRRTACSEKNCFQVSLSTTAVGLLLLFSVLPAVMSTKRYNVFLHKGECRNRNYAWEKPFRFLYNWNVTVFLKIPCRYCDNSFLEMSFRH